MYHEQELIYLYHLGSQIAYELLFEEYKGFVEKYLIFNYIDTVEQSRDDYIQVALLAFFKTLDNYRFDMNTKMITYFSHTIIDAIRTSIRYANTQKHIPYNKLLSLNEDRREYMMHNEVLNDKTAIYKPDVQLRLKEDMEYYQGVVDENGSSFEKEVFYYLVYGYCFKEIAKILNVDIRKVYNAKYRLQKKLAKMK